MKTFVATTIAILSLTTIAHADNNLQHHAGYVGGEIYMASGPGPEFPVIIKLSKNDAIDIHGCLVGWTWCDVTARSRHGWVIGTVIYLNDLGPIAGFGQNAGVPLATFDQPIYWNSYYRGEPFYNNGQYGGGYHGGYNNGGGHNVPSQPTTPQTPIATAPSTNVQQQPLSKLGQISQDKQNEISNKLTGSMNK